MVKLAGDVSSTSINNIRTSAAFLLFDNIFEDNLYKMSMTPSRQFFLNACASLIYVTAHVSFLVGVTDVSICARVWACVRMYIHTCVRASKPMCMHVCHVWTCMYVQKCAGMNMIVHICGCKSRHA